MSICACDWSLSSSIPLIRRRLVVGERGPLAGWLALWSAAPSQPPPTVEMKRNRKLQVFQCGCRTDASCFVSALIFSCGSSAVVTAAAAAPLSATQPASTFSLLYTCVCLCLCSCVASFCVRQKIRATVVLCNFFPVNYCSGAPPA